MSDGCEDQELDQPPVRRTRVLCERRSLTAWNSCHQLEEVPIAKRALERHDFIDNERKRVDVTSFRVLEALPLNVPATVCCKCPPSFLGHARVHAQANRSASACD